MAKNYHYLIAGLPDISFDDTKKQVDMLAFKEELKVNLLKEDYELVKFFFYKFDNQNLLNILEKKDNFNKLGIFTEQELDDEIKRVKDEGANGKGFFPLYMQLFIQNYLSDSFEDQNLSNENRLAKLYFEQATKLKNDYIRNYYQFEMNMLNILTASFSRKYELEYENEIIGTDEISNQIRKSSAKDFNLGGELEISNALLQIIDISDIKERERRIDQLRWNYIETEVFFHYFTVERLFAYLLRLEVLERWTGFSFDKGKEKFDEILQSMQSSYEFPEEYKKNKV